MNTFTNPKIAKLYQDVPHEQLEQFRQFRAAYPYQCTTIDNVSWEYITAGQSNTTLLLLPGALGVPDISWQHVIHFAGRYRVIAPTYPPVKQMDVLVDGIAEILRHEGVEQAHVLGGSYGGMVAQVLVRRHPALTTSLILSHTLPPDPTRGERVGQALRWLSLLPMVLLRWVIGRSLSKLLPEKSPDTALLRAIFYEMMRYQLTKEDVISSAWRALDFSNSHFTPQDLANWPGQVLLIMADDDPSTPEPVRAAMQALYPVAQTHLFQGTGHASSVLKEDEFRAVVERFIDLAQRPS